MVSKDTYDFFVMGFQGAGKTTFLTNFYRDLGYPRANRCFHLEAPPKQKKLLIDNFMALSHGKWPPASQETTKWEFQCQLTGKQTYYKGIKINYFDYAGGHLEAGGDIANRIEKSDSILCLLDGSKIGSYFGNFLMKQIAKSQYSRLSKDLEYLLGLLTSVPPQTPLQFAIMKWDLLERNLTLNQVREELFKNKNFSSCIDTRKTAETCHLIPVSSVGSQFLQVQWTENDLDPTIQVRSDPVLKSLNINIPFFFAVLDVLKAHHKNIEGELVKAKEHADTWKNPSTHLKFRDSLIGASGKGIKKLSDWFPWLTPVSDSLGNSLLDKYSRKCQELEDTAAHYKQTHAEKEDEHETHQKMLNYMEAAVRHFEEEFPGSDLSKQGFV